MFKNERDYPCRCQDVWSRSTSTRSFSLSLYREAKVCRIELTYNPVWLAHDHAIDCGPLSSRNAFTLYSTRGICSSIEFPDGKRRPIKLASSTFKAKSSTYNKSRKMMTDESVYCKSIQIWLEKRFNSNKEK